MSDIPVMFMFNVKSFSPLYILYIFFFSPSEHTPGAYSLDASGALGLSEKTFLNGNKHSLESETETTTVPSLDDFDKELQIFRVS